MKNKKGFTLIELIVIIVLLGVIMVFALPNITSTLERNKKDKMILDAQDMVEKYKNYMLNFKIKVDGSYFNIYSILSSSSILDQDTVTPMIHMASCSYSNDDLYNYYVAPVLNALGIELDVIRENFLPEDNNYKNVILTKLSIPLGNLDKRGEILESPFGSEYIGKSYNNYKLTFDDYGQKAVGDIHSEKKVSYVYMCINDDKTINYKVCLMDEKYTLEADVLDLNSDNKYTKITTGKSCDIDQKIE